MGIERIERQRCTRCCRCYEVCPMDVIQSMEEDPYIAYPDDCMCCFLCEMECPVNAITVTGRRPRDIPFPY